MAQQIPVHGAAVVNALCEMFGLDEPDEVMDISIAAGRGGNCHVNVNRRIATEDGSIAHTGQMFDVVHKTQP